MDCWWPVTPSLVRVVLVKAQWRYSISVSFMQVHINHKKCFQIWIEYYHVFSLQGWDFISDSSHACYKWRNLFSFYIIHRCLDCWSVTLFRHFHMKLSSKHEHSPQNQKVMGNQHRFNSWRSFGDILMNFAWSHKCLRSDFLHLTSLQHVFFKVPFWYSFIYL